MAAGKAVLRSAVVAAEERLLARKAASELAGLATRELKGAELKAIRGAAAIGRPPLLSAEELNKPVQQIGAGMGPKRMLTPDERSGVMRILNVLDRIRANPEDLSALSRDLGDRALKKMRYGNYAKEGWYEIYVLEGNPGAFNQMRVIVRILPGKMEVRLLQMH